MSKIDSFIDTVLLSYDREIIKKLVFSRPRHSEISKVSARLVAHRGRRMLAFEYSLPGNTVSHKNVTGEGVAELIRELMDEYCQANLITTLGDVEWKISSKGKEALLGADKLAGKIQGGNDFERAIESLDNKKNYILKGDEDFLIRLGISDKNGRVHDKKQGKFRQINRFLEIIEDMYGELPTDGSLTVYDLCCGKSYLSFAVYYYLTAVKHRHVKMLGIDLKRDCISWCSEVASSLGYVGMTFVTDDIKNTPADVSPDMVISLHACDVATDIVLNQAVALGARVILSTPCCHKYLNDKVKAHTLAFVMKNPHLANKLCEALTDSIRVARLEANGYTVSTLELVDPEDTPKNTLIRAIKLKKVSDCDLKAKQAKYEAILDFVLEDGAKDYLNNI